MLPQRNRSPTRTSYRAETFISFHSCFRLLKFIRAETFISSNYRFRPLKLIRIAENKTLHNLVPQIFVKVFPLKNLWLQRVMQNILANERQVLFIADHVIVESFLPEMPGTGHTSVFIEANPIEAGDGFVNAHDVAEC